MSTKQKAEQAQKKMVTPNDSATEEEEEDDVVRSLIYRESQLRKAEAAAKSKKTSSASTHHRTSTRKRSPVTNPGKASLPSLKRRSTAKMKRESSIEKDPPREKVATKKYRYECSADGCSNHVVKEGVCIRHGAKVKLCSFEGCTKRIVKGGVCIGHGAKRTKKK